MKRLLIAGAALLLSMAQLVHATLPPPTEEQKAKALAARAKAEEAAKLQAAALARAQDHVVEFYKRSLRGEAPAQAKVEKKHSKAARSQAARKRIERLACLTGTKDRHARIGVEVVGDKVNSFAYYSKWKPRTCSIEVTRGGAYSHWEDRGGASKVTLVDDKGVFLIDHRGPTFRFVFRDIDRGRYCGMDGKINGILTVTRGKAKCGVQGVMDDHSG